MPQEFYHYWKANSHPLKSRYPFLTDLLQFEWVEVEVFMMADADIPQTIEKGNYLSDRVVFNPESRILHLEYPVHLKNARHISSSDRGAYYLLVFRELDTGKVQFMDLSALLVVLLENLMNERTLKEVLEGLKQIQPFADENEFQKQSLQFLETLGEKKFLLGFHPHKEPSGTHKL
jgi:hypothetical protein